MCNQSNHLVGGKKILTVLAYSISSYNNCITSTPQLKNSMSGHFTAYPRCMSTTCSNFSCSHLSYTILHEKYQKLVHNLSELKCSPSRVIAYLRTEKGTREAALHIIGALTRRHDFRASYNTLHKHASISPKS